MENRTKKITSANRDQGAKLPDEFRASGRKPILRRGSAGQLSLGRELGSTNSVPGAPLEMQAAKLKRMNVRLPEGATEEEAAIAEEAFQTFVSLMRGEFRQPKLAALRFKGAKQIRDEICGPVVQKMEIKTSLAELLSLAASSRNPTISTSYRELPEPEYLLASDETEALAAASADPNGEAGDESE